MSEALHEHSGNLHHNFSNPKLLASAHLMSTQREGARRALAALDAAERTSDPKVAQEVVARFLDRYTAGQPLPTLIDRFLKTHLRSFLTHLCIAEGEHGPNWRKAASYTQKLVWSVQPKHDNEDRKQLFALLPALFQWVHQVIRSTHLAVSLEDAFFAGLSQLHAMALNPQAQHIAESAPEESIKSATDTRPVEYHPSTEEETAAIAQTEDRPHE